MLIPKCDLPACFSWGRYLANTSVRIMWVYFGSLMWKDWHLNISQIYPCFSHSPRRFLLYLREICIVFDDQRCVRKLQFSTNVSSMQDCSWNRGHWQTCSGSTTPSSLSSFAPPSCPPRVRATQCTGRNTYGAYSYEFSSKMAHVQIIHWFTRHFSISQPRTALSTRREPTSHNCALVEGL